MAYKNQVLAEKVRQTFSSSDATTVRVKNNNNPEIRDYIKDLEAAYKKTSENSIKFG